MCMTHITHTGSLPQIVSIVSEEALYIFLICFAKFFLSVFVLTKEWFSLKWEFIICVYFPFCDSPSLCPFTTNLHSLSLSLLSFSLCIYYIHCLCAYSKIHCSVLFFKFQLLEKLLVYKQWLWTYISSPAIVFYVFNTSSMPGGKALSLHFHILTEGVCRLN